MAKNKQQSGEQQPGEQPQFEACSLRPHVGLHCYFWQVVNGRLRGYPAQLLEKSPASNTWNVRVSKFRVGANCDLGCKCFADGPKADCLTLTLPEGCDDGWLPKEETESALDLSPAMALATSGAAH